MSSATRTLHDAIDARARATGIPWLHPGGPTIQLDQGGSGPIVAWQERKGELTFSGEACWAELPPIYARYGTPQTLELIRAVKAMEKAQAALVTDCGMQAIALTFDTLMQPGAHAVLMRQVYAKTATYLELLASRIGGRVTVVDDGDWEGLRAAIEPKTALLFAETFTNPRLRAQNPERLGALAQRARREIAPDLRLILDTTIASPWGLKQPALSWPGVDVIASSGTKSAGGQDQDLWGYIATNDVGLANQIMDLMAMRGGIVESRRAAVIAEGLSSRAPADFERRCRTATAVAEFLARHPRVSEVFHPSRPDHPDRATVEAYYRYPGSLLSFRVAGADEQETSRVADRIAQTGIIRYALSFDGLVSKVNHHKTVSEFFTPDPVLRRNGFDRLVRLGIGLEDETDLCACLGWALKG